MEEHAAFGHTIVTTPGTARCVTKTGNAFVSLIPMVTYHQNFLKVVRVHTMARAIGRVTKVGWAPSKNGVPVHAAVANRDSGTKQELYKRYT